ncbi:hypothetical protein GQ53DRAFT_522688 [Thozetella sp. PMI_491]|nr:hypothetical protein GQ53DRAFT_522688 [Thozetella sp. PMI_491]
MGRPFPLPTPPIMFSRLLRPLAIVLLCTLDTASAIWPAPVNYTSGSTVLYLHQNVEITYNGAFVCWPSSPTHPCLADGLSTEHEMMQQLPYTYGYEPRELNSKQVVQAGVSRTLDAIFHSGLVPWVLRKKGVSYEPDLSKGKTWLKSLQIVQTGTDKPSTFKPQAGEVDESYSLTVSTNATARLTAVSSIGVLRGLETFTQLFYQHSHGPFWYTPFAPVVIQDKPKFQHRGLMLDVARTWYDVDDILRTIDAMSWSKMNRFHVHVTDSQSWPIEIPAIPELAKKGAYRPDLTYSPEDIRQIQRYGALRGVEVYFEIDMPGHIGSVAWSHPELITAFDAFPYYWWCAEPPCGAFKLNDSAVDAFLDKVMDDLLPRVAPYSAYFHTGGDELNANDSMLDPGVKSNASSVLQPLLQKFIDKQHARVRKAGLAPITWEEIPLDWNVTIGKDVVVHAWLGDDSVKKLVANGTKVIDSNYNYWYLDCGRGEWLSFDNGEAFETYYPFDDWCGPLKNWRLIYSHDPVGGLTDEEAKNVLGGEVAVWSETIDPINMDSIIWPRAAAAAEVLWSGRVDPKTGQNRSQIEAAPRLNELRERMVARGVGASPIQMPWCSQAANGTECSYPMGPGY